MIRLVCNFFSNNSFPTRLYKRKASDNRDTGAKLRYYFQGFAKELLKIVHTREIVHFCHSVMILYLTTVVFRCKLIPHKTESG
jgi:hypothetical protein